VLDAGTGRLVRKIQVDADPAGVAVDSEHGVAFVSDRTSIKAIDTATLRIVDEVGRAGPCHLTVYEDGAMLLMANESNGSVTLINTVSRKVARTVVIGGRGPFDVAVDRSARRAYATGGQGSAIAVIDLGERRLAELLATPRDPYGST
jgi:YVTN family beta-propeller protein